MTIEITDESNNKIQENHPWHFVKTLFFAILIATIVRSFLYEPFHIPSSSMKPGLQVGDYIFVSKYSYGYSKYSFPFSLNIFSGRFFSKQPQRGDVVVFRLPTNPSINYIKRLIGLPGDTIKVIDGQVYINKTPVPKNYVNNFTDENGSKLSRFEETLPEGKKIIVLDESIVPQDNTGTYTVPNGHYFMMGDNRDNSEDSRFLNNVGYIPEENLIGRAEIIFFSTSQPFWQFWNWYSSIRINRLFQSIN